MDGQPSRLDHWLGLAFTATILSTLIPHENISLPSRQHGPAMTRPSLTRRWTPEEDALLTALIPEQRLSKRAIAVKIRRSVAATHARANTIAASARSYLRLSDWLERAYRVSLLNRYHAASTRLSLRPALSAALLPLRHCPKLSVMIFTDANAVSFRCAYRVISCWMRSLSDSR